MAVGLLKGVIIPCLFDKYPGLRNVERSFQISDKLRDDLKLIDVVNKVKVVFRNNEFGRQLRS